MLWIETDSQNVTIQFGIYTSHEFSRSKTLFSFHASISHDEE